MFRITHRKIRPFYLSKKRSVGLAPDDLLWPFDSSEYDSDSCPVFFAGGRQPLLTTRRVGLDGLAPHLLLDPPYDLSRRMFAPAGRIPFFAFSSP